MITETSWKLWAAGEQMVYINIIQWVYGHTAAHLIYTAMLRSALEMGLNLSSIPPSIHPSIFCRPIQFTHWERYTVGVAYTKTARIEATGQELQDDLYNRPQSIYCKNMYFQFLTFIAAVRNSWLYVHDLIPRITADMMAYLKARNYAFINGSPTFITALLQNKPRASSY